MNNKKFLAGATLAAFATTMVPVAAFAADTQVSADASYIATVDKDVEVEAKKDVVDLVITLNDAGGDRVTTSQTVYVWAEQDGKSNQASSAFQVLENDDIDSDVLTHDGYVYAVDVENASSKEFYTKFVREGNYNIKASFENPNAAGNTIKDVEKLTSPKDNSKVEVTASTTNSNDWTTDVVVKNNAGAVLKTTTDAVDGDTIIVPGLAADSRSNEVTVTLKNDTGNVISNKEVAISANSSNVTLSKEKATTNYNGEVKFKVASEVNGKYVVTLDVDKYTVDLEMDFGSQAPVKVDVKKAPENAVAVDSEPNIELTFADINGNTYKGAAAPATTVEVTKAPEKSKLKDKTLDMDGKSADGDFYTVDFGSLTPDKEGLYEIKVTVDASGKSVKIPFEAKEQGEIVKMELKYDVEALALGGNSGCATIVKSDEDGVAIETKLGAGSSASAAKVELGVSGAAVDTFTTTDGTVKIKNDEKYVGKEVTVTAVDKKNNLVATHTFTVADELAGVAFANTNAQINVNNKIQYSVTDASGKKVALGNGVTIDVDAFIIDQPEGAKASVIVNDTTGADLKTKGVDTLTVTSAKEGTVKVQVMVKATNDTTGVSNYYNGVAEINFGKEAIKGNTVTMFIGSPSFLAGGETKTMDVAPFVKDNRTFVPVRAFGEALGAKVEYNEETQVITAEKDGLTVTMTVGSNVITTSKGETITADVAAFVAEGNRTVLPLRAAAEAFGCDVEAIFAADGTTAGVIFTTK